MNLQVVYKGIQHSPDIAEYTKARLDRNLRKFISMPIDMRVTYAKEKHSYLVRFHLLNSDGSRFDLKNRGDNLIQAINTSLDKLNRVLGKKRRKPKGESLRSLTEKNICEAEEELKDENIDAKLV